MVFFDWVLDHWAFSAFILATVIQITPAIKWNPFTALFKWLSGILLSSVNARLTAIESKVDKMQGEIDENEKNRIRLSVLDFANSCQNGRRHKKEEFEHIIALNQKYQELLERTNDKNGVYAEEYSYILELYRRCQHGETQFL